MPIRKDTKNWISLAEYDLETARHMQETGRYLYVIFMCHIALEKMLKAHVTEVEQKMPVKSHNLLYLIKKAKLELPPEYLEFIGRINTASIPTRYPEDLQKALKDYPKDVARDHLRQTEGIIAWLKKHSNLSK